MKKCIKGFNSDLTCKSFQYEPGKTYTIPEDELSICNRGFHAIDEDECPLAVFDYYPPSIDGKPSRYFEVGIGGKTEKSDEKICGSEIRVGAEIGILGLVKAHIDWVKRHIKKKGEKHEEEDRSSASNTGYRSSASNTGNQSSASNTGYQSSASNTGYQSSASNTGDQSSASNTGYQSSASNTGYFSSASNTGYQSSASNTGNRSSASNTGNRSSASNTGTQSSASNTGYQSSASNTGDCSSAEVSGKESIAAVFGKDCKARGALGCWLVLAERGEWNGETYPIKEVRSVKVDGETIKPMVWYELKDGEVKEVE